MLAQTSHYTSMLEGYVDQAETAGYMASEVYYKAMASKQEENIKQLQGKYSSLISAFDEAVKNGSIEKYSDDWFEMYNQINDVELELQDATTQLIEFNQTLQQLSWDVFDRIQDSISGISEEANFLIDILDSKDLHTDKGVITDEGLAVQGLHAVSYNTYMEQSIAYAEELARIEEEMANDPYDLELVDRRNELIELQQEAIANAIGEKEAIQSLISDGYDKMLESLQKVIDKNKEALNVEKSLFDYQNDIADKTSNIASLRKQLQAYSGDNSEQAKSTIQKLQVSLADAEKDLQQTEYEKFIEDSQQLLDSLMDDTQQFVNQRLDNLDRLVAEAVDATNKNAETISSTIKDTANSYGYEISDQMETIWDSANNVVSIYGDVLHGVGKDLLTSNGNIANAITGGTTRVIETIGGLNVAMQNMTAEINKLATANANSIAEAQKIVTDKQPSVQPIVQPSNPVPEVSTGNGNLNNEDIKGDKTTSNTDTKVTQLQSWKVVDANTGAILCNGGTQQACSSWISSNGYIQVYVNSNEQKVFARQPKYRLVDKSGKIMVDNLTKAQATGRMNAQGNLLGWKMEAYASGTDNAKKGWAIVGEGVDGNEIILDKEGNALLTLAPQLMKLNGGETIINGKDTAKLLTPNLMPLSAEQLWGNIVKTPSLPNVNKNTNNNVTYAVDKIELVLPNVKDYDSLVTQMQHDKRFEKIVQSIAVEPMLGRNSLGKYRH